MINYLGENIKQATPGTPIEILGFSQVPSVGAQITHEPQAEAPKEAVKPIISVISQEETPKLPLVIKADTEGTLEAVLGSFSDDVQVISSGVGPINDTDIFMAEPVRAQVVAFNVSVPKFIKNLADNQKVKIIESSIIYEILEEIESQVLKLLEPTIDETILGEATIKAEFKINKVRIAGINVTKGVLSKGDLTHLKRDGKIIKDTKIENIQAGKEIISSIKMGNECGITFKPYIDFKINDVIISYKKE
ncbi:MAG: Translation initiation factor IF-2 [Candidatus Shapirobacteria bacterium GW2011_GWE1_38_92]|nr:MAG: Translation initiation factor IF-2 [Candidatus Shapirobacteria bacterium GW2011_GWE1_38_92]